MNGPRRFRFLSDEEIDLWRSVASTVAPRPGMSAPEAARVEPVPTVSAQAMAAKGAKARPRSVVPSYTPPQARPRAGAPPLAPIERQYRRRVARGLIGIERVLDLHGLNQAEAHGALRGFLHLAHAQDLRLVLIVTGKGRRSASADAAEAGILRRSVPHWLRESDLRGLVLGFEEASQSHGGAGALYVQLRQRRG